MTESPAADPGESQATAPASRGRIVMLVDNGVVGDSRVQKQARSAAERGWEVVLLGRRPRASSKRKWKVGQAQVCLVDMPAPLHRRRHLMRRAPLRAPLAYAQLAVADYHQQLARAYRADLRAQRAMAQTDPARRGKPGGAARSESARWEARRLGVAVYGRWVALRTAQTIALDARRRSLTSPLDRLVTSFWQRTMGVGSWRRLDPSLWDWELAFGPVIDRLKPDIIHANDFRMIAVGARATARARSKGRAVKLVWDAHEYLPGVGHNVENARWHPAQVAHQREYVGYADAIVTVSDVLAGMLAEEYELTERPAVVMNTPHSEMPPEGSNLPTVRELCAIGPDVPLLVYSGGVAPQRGVGIMVEALPSLPGVHVALVSAKHKAPYVLELLARAKELGVQDRLHLLPYAAPEHVVHYVSTADVGVHPTLHFPNHEISLATKFFEYSHAWLPIVVSDVKTMSEMVYQTGQGEVFVAEDLHDYVRAVEAVLADPEKYRSAYDTPGLLEGWTWEAQAEVLDAVYARVLKDGVSAGPDGDDVTAVY